MRIGWLGLGKLGMPCALALADAGHEVVGVDPAPGVAHAVRDRAWPHDEPGVEELLRTVTTFSHGSLEEAVRAEVVFVAVQTPHEPSYGGETPMPAERRPFDLSALTEALRGLSEAISRVGSTPPVVLVSTVLPGTYVETIEPILGSWPYAYVPAFVAMGSVLEDLESPEFVLIGSRDRVATAAVWKAYEHVRATMLVVGVESAELAKMAYNTAIGQKIVLANALMELATATGADVDEVSDVLELATKRVASGAYLRAGLGDGGPCHPRDAIAMAYLAERFRLSADPFGFAVRAREEQAHWLAARVGALARILKIPVVIVGRAYKPGVSIEEGSAALLVGHYLERMGQRITWYDPRCGFDELPPHPCVALLALPDRAPVRWPEGYVIVDPWGVEPEAPDAVRLGRRP